MSLHIFSLGVLFSFLLDINKRHPFFPLHLRALSTSTRTALPRSFRQLHSIPSFGWMDSSQLSQPPPHRQKLLQSMLHRHSWFMYVEKLEHVYVGRIPSGEILGQQSDLQTGATCFPSTSSSKRAYSLWHWVTCFSFAKLIFFKDITF